VFAACQTWREVMAQPRPSSADADNGTSIPARIRAGHVLAIAAMALEHHDRFSRAFRNESHRKRSRR